MRSREVDIWTCTRGERCPCLQAPGLFCPSPRGFADLDEANVIVRTIFGHEKSQFSGPL